MVEEVDTSEASVKYYPTYTAQYPRRQSSYALPLLIYAMWTLHPFTVQWYQYVPHNQYVCTFLTENICVFCIILRINSYYFLKDL